MSDKIKELLAKDSFDINDLADIVVILRSENGCPWIRFRPISLSRKIFLKKSMRSWKQLTVTLLK